MTDQSLDVAALSTTLDDAMLDAINRLPEQDRPLACDKIRDALTNLPVFRIVDGEATK